MNNQELLSYFDVPFSFRARPVPLQAQTRVVWGLSILSLLLSVGSRGKKSSVKRLHLLNWALKSQENQDRLWLAIREENQAMTSVIKFDPGFDRAIAYAVSESLIEVNSSGKILLAEKGIVLAKEIISIDDCLILEIKFLREIKTALTETLTNRLFKS